MREPAGYPFRTLTKGLTAILLACITFAGPASPNKDHRVDVCIYGASSAGVAAAVAAARQGSTVALVEPTRFIGGMSASGIGLTDRGDITTIGGISREYYSRAGTHYGKEIAWRIEPSVARRVFEQLVSQEPNIKLVRESRLTAVEKTGNVIEGIVLANGSTIRAEVFIDATYEGDLMAVAGVPYTIGREGSDQYGEPLAGVRPNTEKHQFDLPVSPYYRKDDPSSGVLPGVSVEPMGKSGDADDSLPAYTYRLCLTKAPNRIPIDKPDSYNPVDYELLVRYIVARQAGGRSTRLRDIVTLDRQPGGKYDLNNRGPLSTDYVGGSTAYPEGSTEERRAIEEAHKNYIRGLFTFLRSDTRLPQTLRWEAKQFGLAPDEFQETDHWPPLLYVREARRMVGSYVVTQADCDRTRNSSDPIGLASYMIDSHNCRRVIVNGHAKNEGDIQHRLPRPFAIPYQSITPKIQVSRNLLVPVCLSASHVAYSSIRMEPVLMILGESAGIAAALSVETGMPVQLIERVELAARLISAGQILQ